MEKGKDTGLLNLLDLLHDLPLLEVLQAAFLVLTLLLLALLLLLPALALQLTALIRPKGEGKRRGGEKGKERGERDGEGRGRGRDPYWRTDSICFRTWVTISVPPLRTG